MSAFTIASIIRSGNVQIRLYTLNPNSSLVYTSSKTVASSIIQSKSYTSEVYKKTAWDSYGFIIEGMRAPAN